MVLETLQLCVENPTITDNQLTHPANLEIQEAGPVATDTQQITQQRQAFPKSFDTTGNMHGEYSICLDPSFPPVQYARREVPIECREAIEKLLQNMVDQGLIALVTECREWVSSLTYPQEPDCSLCIYLDPRDPNKAIIWEHYKAPTLDEITHKLSGPKVFLK